MDYSTIDNQLISGFILWFLVPVLTLLVFTGFGALIKVFLNIFKK